MKIEILGTGCAKCKSLEKNVRQAVSDLGMKAEIVKVEDMNEIIEHGVMVTPALFIDGKSVSVGKLLTVEDVKKLLAVRK
ncbi:MAG: thioredoxin family protein [Thermoplasmata archaeon]|nr:thioredoxin family protein [Thermoplasmata archaeon]